MHTKDDKVQDNDVTIGLEEVLQLCQEHEGGKEHNAELEHDEAREFDGTCFPHIDARTCEAVDLGGNGTGHHGREVAKEDARRLDAHEVAHAHG